MSVFMSASKSDKRVESDLLGRRTLSNDCYFGIQTQRAVANFDISGVTLSSYPELIKALALVKLACANANFLTGELTLEKRDAIGSAVAQLVDGHHHDQFVVDMVQGGAGTSTNMNVNEVIANLGLESLGFVKGEYHHLHPNNDVNMSQSTNDVYPTAARLAIVLKKDRLLDVLQRLVATFETKGEAFADMIKMGRTQLQDAVPMTLGQEFQSFANTLREELLQINHASRLLTEVNLGGTAIGTGINATEMYGHQVVEELSQLTGIVFTPADDLIEASSDMGAFVLFSAVLKRLAIKLSKICNDLRLLSMGPRCGLNEINLPAVQPGSSIMPGKVNPVIPEVVTQAAYHVIGNDTAITMSAEAGQLQLNAMEPLIVFKVLESMRYLERAIATLDSKCIGGITANTEHCQTMVNNSIGIITAINPLIGYERATQIARQALEEGISVLDIVISEGLIDAETLARVLNPKEMTVRK